MIDRNARALSRYGLAGTLACFSFLLLACGSDESETKRVPSMMGSTQSSTTADGGVNRAPVVEGVSWHPRSPMPGRAIMADADVVDPNGDRTTLAFRWQTPDGRKLGDGDTFDTRGLGEGDVVELVVVAKDAELESEPYSVEIELGGAEIVIDFVAIEAPDEARPGAILEGVVETSNDAGAFEVLYEWKVEGEVVGEDDELDTTDIAPGVPIVLSARLEFDDRTSRAVRSRPVLLSGGGVPSIASTPPNAFVEGTFRYQIRLAGGDPAEGTRFVLADGPAGMEVDARSGAVVWRPTPGQRGDFDVELQVLDRWGSGSAQTFSITVDDPAPPASAR